MSFDAPLFAAIGVMMFWFALGLAGLARSDDGRFVFRILFPLGSGGIFGESYASCGRVANVIPVDVAVPGCPPTPAAIMQGILTAISKTKTST